MAKTASSFMYSLQELAELLVKDAELHEGLWQITVNFALAAGNVAPVTGPVGKPVSSDQIQEVLPSGFVGVKGFGLARVEELGPLVVDASKINPKSDG